MDSSTTLGTRLSYGGHGENWQIFGSPVRYSSCKRVGVRVRITRSRAGELDGVDLADFEVGITYNLPSALAAYLVVTLSAEFVDDIEPVRRETQLFRGVPPPASVAADYGQDDEES